MLDIMTTDLPHETYTPRAVKNLGLWKVGDIQFKIYGLLAEGRQVTDDMKIKSRDLIETGALPRAKSFGDSNELGFVIIHPGETGLSISINWWAMGSVLCQHFARYPNYQDDIEDIDTRPAIGCVWELGIVEFETLLWKSTMMGNTPDCSVYLAGRYSYDII